MNQQRETFSHGYGAMLRRFSGIQKRLLIVAVVAAILAGSFGYVVHTLTLTEQEQTFIGWRMKARVNALAPFPSMRVMTLELDGQTFAAGADEVLAWQPGIDAENKAIPRYAMAGFIGLILSAFITIAALRRIDAEGRELTKDKNLRGSVVLSQEELAKLATQYAKKGGEKAPFVLLGGVPIPRRLEQRNFLIAGTVGAGKTTAIRQLMDVAERRNEPVVVYDPSGDLVAAYYNADRGDVILNPYDARAASWDLFDEVVSAPDARMAAESIAQPAPGARPDEWLQATRSLLADVIWQLKLRGTGTVEELLNAIGYMEKDELAELLSGTPSRRLFEAGAERATASVLFGLPEAIGVLSSLRREAGIGGTFSWRRWAEAMDAPTGAAARPWVFLGAPERQFPTLRPLLAAWINFAAANVLSLAPDQSRRVWLLLDEFASLPRMEAVPRLAAQGRKYGSALVLGIQSPSQLAEVYGHDGAATLVGNAGTQLILRLPGGNAARWATEQLGRQEIERRQASDVYETDEAADASTLVQTREVRDLVLDTEVAELADLAGFMRVPSLGVGRVEIPTDHLQRPKRAPALVNVDPRDLWGAAMPRRAIKAPAGDEGNAAAWEADHDAGLSF